MCLQEQSAESKREAAESIEALRAEVAQLRAQQRERDAEQEAECAALAERTEGEAAARQQAQQELRQLTAAHEELHAQQEAAAAEGCRLQGLVEGVDSLWFTCLWGQVELLHRTKQNKNKIQQNRTT